jgi:hypothetical protein
VDNLLNGGEFYYSPNVLDADGDAVTMSFKEFPDFITVEQ